MTTSFVADIPMVAALASPVNGQRGTMKRIIIIAMFAALVLSACACTTPPPAGGEHPPVTEAPPFTEAPPVTEAPPATEAPSDTTTPEDGESTTPWWLLILVGLGIIILISVFATRGSKKSVIVGAPPVSWKDNARTGYAEARWLYDAMGEDMAVWRGNAKFDGTAEVGSSASTSRSETWTSLNPKMAAATDALYALEAAAPDTRSAEAASASVASLRSVRDALDARAESRFAYRTVEAGSPDQAALMDAREREVRSSRNLVESRNALASALTNLSTIV